MPSEDRPVGFVRDASGLYYGTASNGSANWLLGYLPPVTASGLANSLTLEQSWQAGGTYFVLGSQLNSAPVFVGLARRWLTIEPYPQTRVAWIADPNAALSSWTVTALPAANGGAWIVPSRTTIGLRNYGIVFGRGCSVMAVEAAGAIQINAAAGFSTITMTSADGASQLPIVGGPVRILLSGPAWGSLQFPMTLPVDGLGTGYLDALDAGLRFFYPDPSIPGAPFTSLKYRVFDLGQGLAATGGQLTLDATIDPLRPLDPARTQFAFAPGGPALGCFYRTVLGRPVTLSPVAAPAQARLLFALRPRSGQPGSGDPMYLVPDGSFTLAAVAGVAAVPVPLLLCGTAGTEYIETTADMTLTFVAGQPAYAGNFDPSEGPTRANRPGPRLTAAATTAWAAVTAARNQPTYFAQPDGAPLFQRPDGAGVRGDGTDCYLRYFPVKAAALPVTGALPPASSSYPLAPYAGAATDLVVRGRLEVQVLSQQRRAVVHAISAPVSPPASAWSGNVDGLPQCRAGTPQGLIAEFARRGDGACDGTTWKTLQLAQSVGGTKLTLDAIVDPLRSALLTSQQFLVVSNPNAMQAHIRDNSRIQIADWHFHLDTGSWTRHGTIMILKNTPKRLRELVADATTWVLADAFNSDIGATQRKLQSIINDLPDPDDDFYYFRHTVVDDPNWNGILFLNVEVPLAGLPAQLEGLCAGIDASLFKAHHVGVNQSSLNPDLTQQDSSLFGLIHYEKERTVSAATYDFNVRSLKVLFANASIASFSSKVQVVLNSLFGTAVRQLQTADNMVELNGVYQKHGEADTYVFSETRPTTFDTVDDKVLAAVTIQKATFATLVGSNPAAPQIQTQFAFFGNLAFKELTAGGGDEQASIPYDIFSYDSLTYAGLLLNMDFARAQPQTRAFTFDPSKMAFDPTTSVAREHALARHFPVTVKRMLTASAGGKTAPSLGYMTLGTPLDTTTPGSPWYGLEFDLNLGTVGALAAKAGLIVSLAVVWAPSTYGLPVFVGLKLPLSSGSSNEISIEGIIKISMYARQLLYSDDAFILKLNGIAMSLFGKTLPPAGSFDFFIFGDPDQSAGATSLGWYGAYKKDRTPTDDDAATAASGALAPQQGGNPEVTDDDGDRPTHQLATTSPNRSTTPCHKYS